ncbi:hypothetical protein Patl1_21706 [Pistacia atlantica]|uniref:Uncharacterized protein n=1 Tax=Pistacia atlantica TaxID=434234 RepID=A0ACC1BN12_9ROSI|nr:hypothetical protein Patl1_21706 [Pistacia atlantica]
MSASASKGGIRSQIHLVSVSLGLESLESVEPEKHFEAICSIYQGSRYITKALGILPIGPLFASNLTRDPAGNFWPEDLICLKWLDQQPPQSVIYVAFGSSTFSYQTQFHELALGLELSNRPFLWVVCPGITYAVDDAYPKGFQHRVSACGKMVGHLS